MSDLDSDLESELARVAERESTVRAWVARHDDDLLRRAHRSLPPGPLHGWSLGVKDVIDTADLPTERGSAVYEGRTTANDAACVALARRAGALVVGKTATTEFALFNPTVTTNPHDPERTPGGSSSGSAAAVADGMVRAAFGTQTVGSVIRPAAYCGVVGFKPTHQLVPLTGVATLAHTLDTVGWMTRSVADSASMFEAMTGYRPAVDRGRRGDRPIRIARYRSHQWSDAQPEAMAELDDVADGLAQVAGVEVVDVDPLPHLASGSGDSGSGDSVAGCSNTVLQYEVARVFSWEREYHPQAIAAPVRKMLERADAVELDAYRLAQINLEAARRAHDGWLASNEIDALLTPSAPGEAPPLESTGDPVFNRTWTTIGVPALHLPTGAGPNGLPVGVQLTGARWSDAELLAVAAAVEATLTP
ncbi:MAG: amidase [Acidimicrobiales bacterium]